MRGPYRLQQDPARDFTAETALFIRSSTGFTFSFSDRTIAGPSPGLQYPVLRILAD